MKVQAPTITPDSEVEQADAITVAPQPQVDKKSRDQVLSEIAKDCVVSPEQYLRDSTACTGE